MGTFDTIILAGAEDAVPCAHGHEIRELQTKDLGEGMATYYVWDGLLFRERRSAEGSWGTTLSAVRYRIENERLIVLRETQAEPAPAGEIAVYATCESCLPVLVESPNSYWGLVKEEHPWVQYILRFEGTRLMEKRPDRVESRDDVRRKHPEAIPDDDRVAVRHLERRSKGRSL